MATQLIGNGGFESGDMGPAWRQVPGSDVLDGGVTDATSHQGDFSLRLGSVDFVEQTFVPSVCRATGDLTFYAKLGSALDAGPFFVRVDYRDGSSGTLFMGVLSTDWTLKRVPVDRSKVLSKIVFGTGETGSVYVDDVSLVGSRRLRGPISSSGIIV